MFGTIKKLVENFLHNTNFRNLSEVVPEISLIVDMSTFFKGGIKSLWTKLVFNLSRLGLVNGILDVPLSFIDDSAIIWVKDYKIVFRGLSNQGETEFHLSRIEKPVIPDSISLAFGGPCGSGKTTLIRKLKESPIGNRVKTYVAYTTRPRREREVHGLDYFFVKSEELTQYQNDPRFINFVEARGYWYWIDPSEYFESRWRDEGAVHVFTITQVHEFLELQMIMPDIMWVWIDAEEADLRQRLEKRGDIDIEKSLEQNKRLQQQDRTGLVNLFLKTKADDFTSALQALIQFITHLKQ